MSALVIAAMLGVVELEDRVFSGLEYLRLIKRKCQSIFF
jgi:hypothetical protein